MNRSTLLTWIEITCGALIVLLAVSVWTERHGPPPSAAQQVAHSVTLQAVAKAAQVETVLVARKAASVAARARVRTFRDTLLITDTLEVRSFIARVDTALVVDSTTIAAADTALAAGHAVEAGLRTELALALIPHRAPRLEATVSALYSPLDAVAAASVGGSLRIIGTLSVLARADQRFAPGERPRLYVGFSVRL